MRALQYLLLLLLVISSVFVASSVPRQRRQIDLTLSAEHDDKDDETELALEAIAGLWQSADSRTKVDGSASLVHRTHGGTQSGMGGSTKYQARFHLHHDYKQNAYPS